MATIDERVSKRTGKTTYRVRVRVKGAPTEVATFDGITKAKHWAQATESAIRDGKHFKSSEAKRHTLNDVIDRYLKEKLYEFKDQAKPKVHLRYWKDYLGEYSLFQITPVQIVKYRDKLVSDGLSNSTANRYTNTLSRILTVASRDWGWLEDSPMRKVKKLKEPTGRVRYLSKDERKELLKECKKSGNPDLYDAVILSLHTGARKMELLSCTWDQVDFNRNVISLEETKSGERRLLALTGEALEVMQKRSKIRRIDSSLVFPSPNNPNRPIDLRSAWEAALERAKVEDFRWHDLRHTFASYLAMSGASLAELAAAMGHKTLQMVQRYAHLSESHVQGVVERMAKLHLGG